jgi:Ser/Thr protein kinase RdoA (MazF antagonist)
VKDYYELTEQGRRNRMRAVAANALSKWDLDVVSMRGMTDATNGVFRLDTSSGERYAMRVGLGPPGGHTADEVRSETEWLHAIAEDSDIVVPEPVPTITGDYVTTAAAPGVPHERPCAVFSWLEGPLLADRISSASIAACGAAMAKLHLHAADFKPSGEFRASRYDRVYPYDVPFTVFEDDIDDLLPPERKTVFEEAYDLVDGAISALKLSEPSRIIHGDFHQWNVKINRGRIAALDFEDMVWGWPVQDIGTALYYFWSHDDFDQRYVEFRRGYETVTPWPDRGGEVDTFIAGRTLVIANDVINQPEWLHAAPEVYERGERRIRDMLDRIG